MADKTPIEGYTHRDKRINNPTEEARDFFNDDEKVPVRIEYPRDPSLDPQLVWKGKDQQDSQALEVESVPIYIQEKIKPQAIIENIRKTAQEKNQQPDLYEGFDGIDFEDLIDCYQHEQNWANRMILGDSLLAMNSLAEKERLKGQVQMIYIDPPYGIKFGSNWQVSTSKKEVKDGKAEDATREPEQIRAYRDTWKLGIHSYLSYLRDRLIVARELLTESGNVFVQIGDENVHLVRCLMDEVFGSENAFASITFKKKSFTMPGHAINDYILHYAKNKADAKLHPLYGTMTDENQQPDDKAFNRILTIYGDIVNPADESEARHLLEQGGKWCQSADRLISQHHSDTRSGEIILRNRKILPGSSAHWALDPGNILRLEKAQRLHLPKSGRLRAFVFWEDVPRRRINNFWSDTTGERRPNYVVQTSTKVIERCLLMTTDPGDLVLDPTCGGGSTAWAAEKWGRRWITIDTSRVALTLARTRLMEAKYPYYLLADSPAGVMKEAELTNDPNLALNAQPSGDIKKGFVYRRVPHITLNSIANNPEIDDIYAKWQKELEPLRVEINRLAGKDWEEWEIPRSESTLPETVDESTKKCNKAIETWWEIRRKRQEAIDACIVQHSENEILYDKPYEDNKRLRVTGRFTVESLSPHRVLSSNPETNDYMSEQDSQSFETMIIENIKKAGVQNTKKAERLKFDWIEPYAGKYIHAEGEYTENDETKRAAVSIGPEYGTVSRDQIKEAAKEAVKGIGFDLLIVCGFTFDPHVSEERTRYRKPKVLTTRINSDLMMGDELLKKTGAGNLFMVFGEPDVKIKIQQDEKVVVKLRGVDVYDPTKGRVKSDSTDGIACWFIDTNYNNESFFVRHAYFTGKSPSGKKKPYADLQKALQAEINKEAWKTLYRTESRPFDKPETGKIAVKVINHYGDEVLKVYDIKN